MRTRFLMIIGILLIATFTLSSAYASCGSDPDSLESCDDPEFLVEKYAQIAEINTDAEDEMKKFQMDLANELQKQNPDQNTIQALHDAISEQEQILLETTKELSEIQKLLTQKIHINPDLKKKLEIARDILHENQDIIPWTGLGVSSTEQAVTISIDAENPEEYRNIIEKLVGKDVPVIINKGGNPFLSGNLLPPLKQFKSGIPIYEIECKETLLLIKKHDGTPVCVTLETREKLRERGWDAPLLISVTRGAPIVLPEPPLISDFKTQYEIAKQIYTSIPKTVDSPYLGMTYGEDKKSILFGMDIAKLTAEKDQDYYEKLFENYFAELTIPYELRFQENLGGDE